VAEVEGIDMEYIHRRVAGRPGNAISDEQHGRFAAAVLLDRVVTDVNSMRALEQAWGKAEGLTKQGEHTTGTTANPHKVYLAERGGT
jgi:hypothetical protein